LNKVALLNQQLNELCSNESSIGALACHRHQRKLCNGCTAASLTTQRGDDQHVQIVRGPRARAPLKPPPKPPIELLVECKGFVGHVLDDRLVAIRAGTISLTSAINEHELLRLAGLATAWATGERRAVMASRCPPRTPPGCRAGRAAVHRAPSCSPREQQMLRTVARIACRESPAAFRQLGLVPQ